VGEAAATLALRKRVEEAIERIRGAASEAEVRRLVADLNGEIARTNAQAASGPPTDIAPLDPDESVRRWRALGERDPS